MRTTLYWLLLSLCTATGGFGQMIAERFQSYANTQDSLLMCAYRARDTKAYERVLAEFLAEYGKLPDAEQKQYARYVMNAYYNLCCTYSLLNEKEKALEYLRKAIEAGYIQYAHMQKDSDLDNIRNEPVFKRLLAPLRPLGDYLFILKNAGTFNAGDRRPLPPFTYQPGDNPNLKTLRVAFNLDSIAGKGSDVFRIINLLHWMHYLIPHDGNHENPIVRNALSMIRECKRDNRGLNCRGLALALNECYLSMGIPSRIVTCLPKDSLKVDPDCHVINCVYAASQKKWIWIDPTNDAYVMNELGEPLSIEEVRERLINDRPLLLNPDANWNRESITKESYLYSYMAKNLYMFDCPANSEYDMESKNTGNDRTYIRLVPVEHYLQSPDVTEVKRADGTSVMRTYLTNNAKLFWITP